MSLLEARLSLTVGELRLNVELSSEPGEIHALLGANGAGKTSLVRAIAGLRRIESGSITVDGRLLDEPESGVFVPPELRSIGVVFQDYLLFPHLNVLDNVAFGPRARRIRQDSARTLAQRRLDALGIGDLAQRRPSSLSGGQAQRVALARALAIDPRLLLLDEPFAALDATSRGDTRRDLAATLRSFDGAAILVTHDPLDVLTMADRVTVIESGRVSQTGTLTEVTAQPRSQYVADLLGVNLWRGHGSGSSVRIDGALDVAVAGPIAGPAFAVIRPSSVSLHHGPPETSARNRWSGTVRSMDLLGDRVRVRVALDRRVTLCAEVTRGAIVDLDLQVGAAVWASVKATEVVAYPV